MKLQIPVNIELGFPELSAGCALMLAAIEYSRGLGTKFESCRVSWLDFSEDGYAELSIVMVAEHRTVRIDASYDRVIKQVHVGHYWEGE
ncbi:MAG: hypothetical protein BWY95_01119 [Bacteroidetes bacterium ADurb.BinA104]|nr:MAG: hypothetical protein BWY95_01119 [Bacteroidetes bacterium ADurb.BinA104]